MGEHGKTGNGAESINLRDALEERYLAYALSTIMHRALPDVRDGLKPVHRRLLYAMQQLKLDPEGGFKKCARVVGDVIGKYHPHGDQAVYDALVRLAQDFAVRFPLVEGQGNFGNIDGDNAAAMRYTESKLTAVAAALLEDISDDTVDFLETYDGEENEPVVLPANFPNLLANGATGIAVGMATSIPPHNAGELCDAALHLIKFPNARVEKLTEYVPGPDFPTGGIIVEPKASILEAYKTGRVEYLEEELNELMHEKHKNEQKAKAEFDKRLAESRRTAIEENKKLAKASGNKLTQTLDGQGNLVGVANMSSIETNLGDGGPVTAADIRKELFEGENIRTRAKDKEMEAAKVALKVTEKVEEAVAAEAPASESEEAAQDPPPAEG